MAYLLYSWRGFPGNDVRQYHCTGFHMPAQYPLLIETFFVAQFKSSRNDEGSQQRGGEMAMCIVHMRVHCSDKYSEWFVDDAELTELAIESIVGPALLEVFDAVQFENITVQHSAKRDDGYQEQC
jgi:hypothetical protein